MFVDVTKILVRGGKGGNGMMSFRREKYIAAGGPDGGDGGKGGDVVMVVDEGMNTLMDFRYKKKYVAVDGMKGGTNKKNGKFGDDLVIKVPIGTLVKNEQTGKVIADLSHKDDRVVVAKGGRGGRGNVHFASSTRQVPNFAEDGEDGEELEVVLELKLLADVGLAGFPNAGKSTILSMMTSAKPKIANYPFTTLVPNLGIVHLDNGESFVLADIPGIIEGAHEGVGLGFEFLRHIERTKIILHVVDVAGIDGRSPLDDFKITNKELKEYSEKLANKKQILVINKMDLVNNSNIDNVKVLEEEAHKNDIEVFEVSAATGEGIKELFNKVGELLHTIEIDEPEIIEDDVITLIDVNKKEWEVVKEGSTFVIQGNSINRLLKRVNFNEWESIRYFQKVLDNLGISAELKKQGINEGDIVKIDEIEFEYFD